MGVLLNAVIIAWVNLALMTLLQVFLELSLHQALGCAFIGMLIIYIYSGFSGLLG